MLKSAVELEETTRGQSTYQDWFRVRKDRFTASFFHQIRDFDKKTVKRLTSLAKKIVVPVKEIGHVLKMNLSFDTYYEPIAIQMYERYMKTIGHNVSVEECGFVIDKTNYILGANPDGKVPEGSFGIIEVKLFEQACHACRAANQSWKNKKFLHLSEWNDDITFCWKRAT